MVLLTVPLDPDFKIRGQCIDYRNTDAVQATGELVVLIGEFTTGVQTGVELILTRVSRAPGEYPPACHGRCLLPPPSRLRAV